MALATSQSCDTCKQIFVNKSIPSAFIDKDSLGKFSVDDAAYSWRKSAQELQASINQGCSMCLTLQRYFQTGYLRSNLYDATGDIHLKFSYMELSNKFTVGIYPLVPYEEYNTSWLSYMLAPASSN
jgi:hypothetical protein